MHLSKSFVTLLMSLHRYVASALLAVILSGCARLDEPRVVSRADIPGSPYAVVLTEDLKNMHSYQVWNGNQAVTEMRLLGPRQTGGDPQAEITTPAPNVVHIAWTGSGAGKFVTIDLQADTITADANGAGSPPAFKESPTP